MAENQGLPREDGLMEAQIPVRLAPKAEERAEGHLSLVNTTWGDSSKLEAGVSLLDDNVNTLRRLQSLVDSRLESYSYFHTINNVEYLTMP